MLGYLHPVVLVSSALGILLADLPLLGRLDIAAVPAA